MRYVKLMAVGTLGALAGCATTQSGAALQIGPHSYQTIAQASGIRGSGEARKLALESANAKCTALGKTIKVTDISVGYGFPTTATSTVTFECD